MSDLLLLLQAALGAVTVYSVLQIVRLGAIGKARKAYIEGATTLQELDVIHLVSIDAQLADWSCWTAREHLARLQREARARA
jgi:hypothetical protein